MNKNNTRNIGIDTLKIVLAFMVLLIHANARGTGQVLVYVSTTFNKVAANALHCLSYPAVNCYVIISGMFMYPAQSDIYKVIGKLSKIWLQLLFYSLAGYVVACLFFQKNIAASVFISRIFPITTGEWWFYTCYFGVVLISPYVNKMLSGLREKEFKGLIIVMIFLFSVIPFLASWDDSLGVNYGYSFAWFLALYITGAFLDKFTTQINLTIKGCFLAYLALSFFLFISMWINKIPLINKFNFYAYNSIIVYLQSIFLIIGFRKVQISSQRVKGWIKTVSGLAMASYIFHCQDDLGDEIWKLLNLPQYADSMLLMPMMFTSIFCIFCFAVFLEYFRRIIVRKSRIENAMVDMIIRLSKKII